MPRIRVLVVDDAVVVRKIVTDALANDPHIEVVGAAANGRIGLAKIPQVNPDIITLDVEMPEMDGLETLAAIRKSFPKLPVIMFSTLTSRGAATTLDALALGANDYVTKPSNVGQVGTAIQRIREDLIPKIKALVKLPGIGSEFAPPGLGIPEALPVIADHPRRTAPQQKQRVEVLAIGVSTGGPNALAELVPALPADFPVPVLIVQHMPPVFTKLLAERLDSKSTLAVAEAYSGAVVEPGRVWLAPGDYHMVLGRAGTKITVRTNQERPENSCRPAVDPLFRSVAEVYGNGALAVVLTGMGQDGLHGAEVICAAGGQVLAQDEASSVVWGMPGFVARAGLADKVLPLEEMATEIIRRVQWGRSITRGRGSETLREAV